MTLAAAALYYVARLDLRVFPLKKAGKTPVNANGCSGATKDLEEVRCWWEDAPECNIGVATGADSGVWILDVDARSPKGVEGGMTGLEALAQLEERHGALPMTRRSFTSGGGFHLWFRWPADRQIKNRAHLKLDGRPTGIDARGEGGYVVAPPSVHPDGPVYRWDRERKDLHDAPEWLLDWVAPREVAAPVVDAAPTRAPTLDRYGSAALDKACDRIRATAAGNRHETIFREAAGIGELVGGGVIERAAAEAALIASAMAIGKSEREATRTVHDGLDTGARNPRVPKRRPDDEPDDEGAVSDYRPTDVGNAERLVDRFGATVRWCGVMQGDGYLVWDGRRWAADSMRRIDQLTRLVAEDVARDAERHQLIYRSYQIECGSKPSAAQSARLAELRTAASQWQRWASSSEMSSRLEAMATVARSQVAVHHEDLDADQWSINTPGGIVDLRTGETRRHDPEALHTRLAGAGGEEAAGCATWLAFLRRIMGGDDEMVSFLQRVVGYCLTGSTREQALFILYGNGSNGKSTFLDTLRVVLGDYAAHARAESFVRDRKGGIPNDIAALRGARLVTASEPEQGEALDEGLVKEMTGDAALTARFMRGEFFTFQPTFKVLLATNHRPIIRGTDHGIWRRIRLVPFIEKIEDHEKDPDLLVKLRAEADGIFRWAFEGCAEWQRLGGLRPPAAVVAATEDYREDMDILAEFIAERCVVGSSYNVGNSALWTAFREWGEAQGERPRSQRWLARALQDRGYTQDPSRTHGRRWLRIGLKDDYQTGSASRRDRREEVPW
jgi:putative DNA primase/helicase